MRSLDNALTEHELIVLRVIGEWWDLDLHGEDKAACVRALAERLGAVDLAKELAFLPPEEADAIRELARSGGRMPVGTFSRHHGEVRQMGPARMEREEPWYDPVSPAEALWYRGLVYRGFEDAETSDGLTEYFFIPNEFQERLPETDGATSDAHAPPNVLEQADPPQVFDEETTDAVDDLTTILAMAQSGRLGDGDLANPRPFLQNPSAERFRLLRTLASETSLVQGKESDLKPTRSAVEWLKKSRERQLRVLVDAWSHSAWNDLYHTPGLRCEGSGWHNDPILARSALLDAVSRDRRWYWTDQLIDHIRETNADFQRPEGNYDTWYIRDLRSDSYVRGFESWALVEGRLLRFLLEGPMAWLGLTEVGEHRYRLTERALAWLADVPPSDQEVNVPIVVQPDATLLVPHNAGRYQRFQISRIAEPQPLAARSHYHYQLTPASLQRALKNGIQPARVLDFLAEVSGRQIPLSVERAVERWAERGVEGRLQAGIIIRVSDAAILDKLQAHPQTRPYIGERLGDLAAELIGQDWREFQKVTARLGLLLDAG